MILLMFCRMLERCANAKQALRLIIVFHTEVNELFILHLPSESTVDPPLVHSSVSSSANLTASNLFGCSHR
jgi:hypothetical protein